VATNLRSGLAPGAACRTRPAPAARHGAARRAGPRHRNGSMNKHFFALAFAAGLACLAWVAAGFLASNGLALAMTAVIAAVYLLGAYELHQFRAAGRGLGTALQALSQPPAALADWLATVPASLRGAV